MGNPSLWEFLPGELLEKVLTKLPLATLMKFRSVSKHWKNLIESPRVALPIHACGPVACYYFPGDHSGERRDDVKPVLAFPVSRLRAWVKDILPFTVCVSVKGRNLDIVFTKHILVASHGGLICFSDVLKPEEFIIYNPLTRRWRKLNPPSTVLPKLPRGVKVYDKPYEHMVIGLVMDFDTGNYKFLVAGIHQDGPRITFIYDSSTGDWIKSVPVPMLPVLIEEGEWSSNKAICCSGNLYWFIILAGLQEEAFEALLKYNFELNEWAVAMPSQPHDSPCETHIVENDGYVLVLDWFDCVFRQQDIHRRVTELQRIGPEVKPMSEDLESLTGLNEHFYKEYVPAMTVGQGKILYVLHVHKSEHTFKVLVYNEADGSRIWLPEWNYLRDAASLMALTPTLRAFV